MSLHFLTECILHIPLKQNSPAGVLPPGSIWQCLGTFLTGKTGEASGGGQGYCSTVRGAQDAPQQRMTQLKLGSAQGETPCPGRRPQTTSLLKTFLVVLGLNNRSLPSSFLPLSYQV